MMMSWTSIKCAHDKGYNFTGLFKKKKFNLFSLPLHFLIPRLWTILSRLFMADSDIIVL